MSIAMSIPNPSTCVMRSAEKSVLAQPRKYPIMHTTKRILPAHIVRRALHQRRHEQGTLVANPRARRGRAATAFAATTSTFLHLLLPEEVREQLVGGRLDQAEQVVVQGVLVRLAQLAGVVLRWDVVQVEWDMYREQ